MALGASSREVVAEETRFSTAPDFSDPLDGSSIQFPNLKVMRSLKRLALEGKYLLPAGYKFTISNADATVNKPPPGCIAIYRATLTYGLRFPPYEVIINILNKYELAPAQIIPTLCHNICSFVTAYELNE